MSILTHILVPICSHFSNTFYYIFTAVLQTSILSDLENLPFCEENLFQTLDKIYFSQIWLIEENPKEERRRGKGRERT